MKKILHLKKKSLYQHSKWELVSFSVRIPWRTFKITLRIVERFKFHNMHNLEKELALVSVLEGVFLP